MKSENGTRIIPLLPQLADVLPRNRVGLIFPDDEDGGYMRAGYLTRNWKAYRSTVGLPDDITPHCLRHSYATICYEAGLTPRETANFMGDTVEVVERIYTHLRDQKEEDAAEKLRRYHA